MGNILVISDIHINDYSTKNSYDKARLYQNRLVAQNVIKVAQQNNCDTIFIAGDLIDKSVLRPVVLSAAKEFLDTVMSYFKTGRIIYGNHDLDTKFANQSMTDCALSVMLPGNLKYADRTIETIGNSVFAFSNWKPNEIDLTWVPGKVDFLITHATIAYADTDFFKSTLLDENKFDLCISGDIHKRAQKGKFVSIGIPQRQTLKDSEESSGVVINPMTKEWAWVNLNPDDNLLKMIYVNDRTLEGYHPSSNTWCTYKPDKSLIPGSNSKVTQLWAEVDSLIDTCITEQSLQAIHQEVLKRVPSDQEDLDLNFTLTALRCHNWRSIGDLSITIDPGDRIVLHGENGSGKSSILTALKYALLEKSKGLKSFVCNRTTDKSCWTEVDFEYQNHNYTLRRGTSNSTKNWGLIIDGNPQAYPNISAFNKDVARRFPFLQILEYFYFDDKHSRFLGGMKDEEKPILIAKLLKLGKIDTFNEISKQLYAELKKSTESYSFRQMNLKGNIERLNQQKAGISVPERSLELLLNDKQQGYELQRKATEFVNYQLRVSNRAGRIEFLKKDIDECLQEKQNYEALAIIMSNIDRLQNEIGDQRAIESQMTNLSSHIKDLQQQLHDVNTEGSRLYNEYINIKPDVCPTCGQAVNSEVLISYKGNLESRLTDLQKKQGELNTFIQNSKFNQADFDKVKRTIRSLETELQGEIEKKTKLSELKNRYDKESKELQDLLNESNISVVPEKVLLPDDALQRMSWIESEISNWNRLNEIELELNQNMTELSSVEGELQKYESRTKDLEKYICLTSPVGDIYTNVLEKVASEFSDNYVQYEASRFTFRNTEHLDLECYYVVDGQRVLYESASSGQQTIMDIHIMSKLAEGLGLIVFDEFLKSLSPGNHDEMLNVIKDMKVGAILLVSHQEGISGFQNKTMELSLGSDGMTQIQFM